MNELASLTDHLAAVNVAKFSPDDKKLITGGDDMRVLVYDVEKLSINSSARELGSHLGKVSDVEFSKNGDLMASSGWGGNVIIWDMHNEKEYLSTNAGHRGPINAVQFQMMESIYIHLDMMAQFGNLIFSIIILRE